jgi:hypothetical protein
MILGGGNREAALERATLDDLFRRAGVRRSDALALCDPRNREAFATGRPRQLTYAQADRAIAHVAARLRRLGLATDTVVALHLPNTVECAIALLGILRAGMIAALLPTLWRKHDMVTNLARLNAKAIVTQARTADDAMQAAAELFPVRYVCAFGQDVPDGVMALDDCFVSGPADFVHPPARAGNPSAHVAVVTFDLTAAGIVPVARSHGELIAGGLAVLLEGGIVEDATILSTISLASFAGLAATLMPWLIAGGTLALHHGFDADSFATQCRTFDAATVVLPGATLAPLAGAGLLDGTAKNVLALWRAPERLALEVAWTGAATLTDIACFGEVGLLPARRAADGLPVPIPDGGVAAPRGAAGAVAVVECGRSKAGTLTMRGPMVPAHAFPPSAEPIVAPDGFADTGFACRLDRDTGTLTVTAPPAGLTAIGGYRFRQNDVDRLVTEAAMDASVVAIPDALLGQRLAGNSSDRARTSVELQVRGVNPLIAGAFRTRQRDDAA